MAVKPHGDGSDFTMKKNPPEGRPPEARRPEGRPPNARRPEGRPPNPRKRRMARERTLQALYQWDLSSTDASTIRTEFLERQDMSRVDVDYFIALFNGVSHDVQRVDDALQPALDRPLNDLDPIERAVLRVAVYELQNQLDIPVRVVINEGIEITKRYGADKGHKYVNGVLDKLAVVLRPVELPEG